MRIPPMVEVTTSSNVKAIGWCEGQLHMRFNGGSHYVYDSVPHRVYIDLLKADSVGKHFSDNVKGLFTHRKIA